jgi:hypothetical protein
MVAAPIMAASAVNSIGLNRTAPASSSTSSLMPWRTKSMSRIDGSLARRSCRSPNFGHETIWDRYGAPRTPAPTPLKLLPAPG